MSLLNWLTIIIHRYFEENTFQYSSIRRRLVCFGSAGPRIQSRCDLYFADILEFNPVYPGHNSSCNLYRLTNEILCLLL